MKGMKTMVTFEDIQKANTTLTPIDVKGKGYIEVNQRIKAFRMLFPMGTIKTSLLADAEGRCIMQAEVFDGDLLLATGTAYEREQSSYINKTSYIENCETSAVGRALGMLGLGIDTSIASKEEVENAIQQQAAMEKPPAGHMKALRSLMDRKGVTEEQVLERYELTSMDDITMDTYNRIAKALDKSKDKA